MTEQAEPNETAARMHADCCGCVRRGDLHRERFERWVQKVEAQAKREGAREALEKAAQIFDETAKQKQKLVWIPEAIAQQIRSLIEPTPVKPKVKSCVRCGSPYQPDGKCSRWQFGCQGGIGEWRAPPKTKEKP